MTTSENRVTECPVAALADEARALIAGYRAASDALAKETDENKLWHLEHGPQSATYDFLKATIDRATYLRALSAKGALFQLCVVSELAEDLEAFATPTAEVTRISEKIKRTLHSVSGFIEKATGAGLVDSCSDYFLDPQISDHAKIEEAMALSEAAKASA